MPADKNKPAPIDVVSLLESVKTYTNGAAALLDPNVNKHPANYIRQQKTGNGREPYLDYLVAALRGRDNEPPDQFNPCFFESTKDFGRYLRQRQLEQADSTEDFCFQAIVPRNNGKHALYYDVVIRNGKVSVIGIESANLRVARNVLKELLEVKTSFPDAIYNAAVIATDMQKSAIACDMYAITNLSQDTNFREKLNQRHDKQLNSKQKQFECIVDSYGEEIGWRPYERAQSQTQTEVIVYGPTHGDLNLLETALPNNNAGDSLLANNKRFRVTQEVESLDADNLGIVRTLVIRNFSNKIDHDRLVEYRKLETHLQNLIDEHGAAEAGIIFASEVAGVRVSSPPDWESQITNTRQLLPNWDPRRTTTDSDLSELPVLDASERIKIVKEMLAAAERWSSFPTSRINALSLAVRIAKDLARDQREDQDETLAVDIKNSLAPIPFIMKQLAQDIWEVEELDLLLELHGAYLDYMPDEDIDLYLEEVEELKTVLNSAALQSRANNYLATWEEETLENESDEEDISVDPAWQEIVPSTHRLISDWNPIEGTTQDDLIECDSLTPGERLTLATELLTAATTWKLSPTLRHSALSMAAWAIECNLGQSQSTEIYSALTNLPNIMQVLAPEIASHEELGKLLQLHQNLLKSCSEEIRANYLQELPTVMQHLNSASLRSSFGEYTVAAIADACATQEMRDEYIRPLLASISEVMRNTENETERLDKFGALVEVFDPITHETKGRFSSSTNNGEKFELIVEIATNSDADTIQALLIGNIKNLNEEVETLRATKPDWISFKSLQESRQQLLDQRQERIKTINLDEPARQKWRQEGNNKIGEQEKFTNNLLARLKVLQLPETHDNHQELIELQSSLAASIENGQTLLQQAMNPQEKRSWEEKALVELEKYLREQTNLNKEREQNVGKLEALQANLTKQANSPVPLDNWAKISHGGLSEADWLAIDKELGSKKRLFDPMPSSKFYIESGSIFHVTDDNQSVLVRLQRKNRETNCMETHAVRQVPLSRLPESIDINQIRRQLEKNEVVRGFTVPSETQLARGGQRFRK